MVMPARLTRVDGLPGGLILKIYAVMIRKLSSGEFLNALHQINFTN